MGALGTTFLTAWPGTATPPAHTLDEVLTTLLETARQARPEIGLDEPSFVRFLAGRVPTGEDPGPTLERLHAGDLLLVFSILAGDAHALQFFEREYLRRVPTYVQHLRLSAAEQEDLTQALGDRLLLCEDGRAPRLAEYAGRGSLEGWIRVAAIRLALNQSRGEKRARHRAEDAHHALPPAPDPELEIIRVRYRGEFDRAFKEAMAALPPRSRSLLSLRFADGLGATEMATLYGVHRATIARWLGEAQQAVFERTRQLLRERLGISSSECDSLLGVLRSRLEVTFSTLLCGVAPQPSGVSSEPPAAVDREGGDGT